MKFGILTINDINNYGNRLQNYALQEQLKKFGAVETIKNIQGLYNSNYKRRIIDKLKSYIKRVVSLKLQYKQNVSFENFERNIKYSKILIDKNHIPSNIGNKFDKFIIGSDQVWNPNFNRMSEIDFAMFAPCEKVVSYAASFGISSIPEEQKNFYIDGLNNISEISVREDRGAEIVKELTGRDVKVVLDPTLLLAKKDWEKVMKKPKYVPNKKYILTYFLGNISDERKKKFKELANNNDFEIVNLGKMEYPQYYIAGPSEFLWYFNNAEIVFTDSFHACVFSIIFDKTFYYMNREDKSVSMNSRIETLLSKFKLNNRKFYDWENVSLQHDYSHVQEILEKEKKASLDFLEEALKIKE